MNRRRFLEMLTGAAATMVLDPEKLLWVPGKKTIFIPKPVIKPTLDDWEVVAVWEYGGTGWVPFSLDSLALAV